MFATTLSPETHKALAILGKTRLLNRAYLAGGTACALWLGHRRSYDLDFFTPVQFKKEPLLKKLSQLKTFKVRSTAWGTILATFHRIDFSLFYYRYPLLKRPTEWNGIHIASLEDISAMKIDAIGDRGTKRDFIDLYYICKKISLLDVLRLYNQKYRTLASNRVHLLKSLVYFEDAENDEMPRMHTDIAWKEVKQFFMKQVKAVNLQQS